MTIPMVHLICGSTGAGKTTYARRLAKELSAVHFAIDEWMTGLFGPDADRLAPFPWIAERISRCERQIAATTRQLGRLNVPAVLDVSLQRIEQRDRWRAICEEASLGVRLHFIDVDADERWRRVNQRNERKGETYSLTVTRPMFDFIETIWQPPSPEEISALNGVRIAA